MIIIPFLNAVDCNSCENCTAEAAEGNKIITLTADLSQSGDANCIDILDNNITIDCNGHRINGSGYSNSYYGIHAGVVELTLDSITVKNCNIDGWNTDIYLEHVKNAQILNNNASLSYYPIYVIGSDSVIDNNKIECNDLEGSYGLYFGDNSNVTNNLINNCGVGLSFEGDNNKIFYNNIQNSTEYASYIYGSYNILENNLFSNYPYGVYFSYSSNYNNLINNTLQNGNVGIYFYARGECEQVVNGWHNDYENENNIVSNIFINNNFSVKLYNPPLPFSCSGSKKVADHVHKNYFINNSLYNSNYGFYIVYSNENVFEGNMFSNIKIPFNLSTESDLFYNLIQTQPFIIRRNIGGSAVNFGVTDINLTNTKDSAVYVGHRIASVNLDVVPELNKPATVTLTFDGFCPVPIYYYANFTQDVNEIIANGQICNETTTPACTNIACTTGSVTFNVEHFDGYGAGDGAVPELSDITLILAIAGVLGLFVYMKKRN